MTKQTKIWARFIIKWYFFTAWVVFPKISPRIPMELNRILTIMAIQLSSIWRMLLLCVTSRLVLRWRELNLGWRGAMQSLMVADLKTWIQAGGNHLNFVFVSACYSRATGEALRSAGSNGFSFGQTPYATLQTSLPTDWRRISSVDRHAGEEYAQRKEVVITSHRSGAPPLQLTLATCRNFVHRNNRGRQPN